MTPNDSVKPPPRRGSAARRSLIGGRLERKVVLRLRWPKLDLVSACIVMLKYTPCNELDRKGIEVNTTLAGGKKGSVVGNSIAPLPNLIDCIEVLPRDH